MRQRISPEQERMVVSAYAQAKTVREAAKYADVAVGAAQDKIEKARERISDLSDLRRFYGDLRKRGFGPIDVEHTVSTHMRLDEMNLTLDQLSQTADFLEKTGYGEQTLQHIEAGITLQKLEAESGLKCQKLLDWYRRTAPTKKAVEKQITDLIATKEQLETELQNLRELKKMKDTLHEKGVTLHKLEEFLTTQLTLEKLGFTNTAANILATELSKTGMSPENAARRIATLLVNFQSLESAVYNLQDEKKALNAEIERLKTSKAGFEKNISEKQKDLKNLESEMNEYRNKKVGETEKELAQMKAQLRTLNDQVEEKRREMEDLQAKKENFKNQIILGEGLTQVLRDPKSTTLDQLRRLSELANRTVEWREKGLLLSASSQAADIKPVIAEILTEYVKTDLVPITKYNDLQKDREFYKTLTDYQKTIIAKTQKESEEKDRTITKLNEEIIEAEKAIGLEMIKKIKTNYESAPIPVLENIKQWIDQVIWKKKGNTPYSTVQLSEETHQWLGENIEPQPQTQGKLFLRSLGKYEEK